MHFPFWSFAGAAAASDAGREASGGPAAAEAAKPPSGGVESTGPASEPTFTVTRDEVGRATWTLLHSIASHYPDEPTRQQQKDVKGFVDSLSRLYPCEVCAHHFQQILRDNPPRCSSSAELRQWTCDVHNTVNRSLKKPTFNCSFLQARWGAVDCGTNGSCRVHFGDASRSLRNAR